MQSTYYSLVNVSVAIGDGFINEVTVFEGRHVDISCIFTGIPVPTSVTWTFDSQTTNFSQFDRPRDFTIELRSGSTVPVVTNGELTSTLRIVNAQYPSNDGVFECIGEVATERTNVTVRVLGENIITSWPQEHLMTFLKSRPQWC